MGVFFFCVETFHLGKEMFGLRKVNVLVFNISKWKLNSFCF